MHRYRIGSALRRCFSGQSFLVDRGIAAKLGEIGAEKLRLLGILKRSQ
ncbi:hypothetical protein Z949_2587 [Sulfitobacter guttiformis KCTC 32187]|nr:hypothetical protein Z949_2587 [Sulfitobacter guttiformis KCTC 32187]